MDQVRVSVGMPVFNDPAGVQRSVPTVFGQTWTGHLRLIIVDDGSTDETPDVIASLAEFYDEIVVVRNETNEGRPAARNRILEHAGDGYLAWIDAGDLWHPRKLEFQMAALTKAEGEQPGASFLCVGPHRRVFDGREEPLRSPDVSGDQLLNALTGKIFPYLQAIVGRAEHFRNLGFDPALLRRQDYDFMVRFVAEGGVVIGAPRDVPVFTYLKSDVGASGDVVAAANRVLRHKHEPYYRRYPGSVARQIRSNQHRLAARFFRSNGQRVRAAIQEIGATVAAPAATSRRVMKRIWRPRRMARRLKRLPIRAIRPILPLLQRSGTIDFARRIGVLRLVSAAGPSRGAYVTLRSQVEETSAARPTPPNGEETPADIVNLERAVSEGADPQTWLDLERAYFKRRRLHSAEDALVRGRQAHPQHAGLVRRLIELLALRRKWAECVELWTTSDNLDDKHLSATTYSRVARSFRELGRYDEALEVAEVGASRWPSDFRVLDEVYASRAEVVDWGNAVRVTGTEDGSTTGTVTDLGFLRGTDDPLVGWVAEAARTATVTLVVNDVPVAETSAAPADTDTADRAEFSLSCHELRRYLGDGDQVWVEHDGRRLHIAGNGDTCDITTGYASRGQELRRLLDTGHVFTKFGALRMGNTPQRRRQTLDLFEEVSELISERLGYTAYPFYGNLLGAIREHDFIPHDAGGFDMGYISRHSEPEAVRAEFMDLCRSLLDRGYHLRIEPWSVYVRPGPTARIFVDVNYAWFNASGELNLSFGWRGAPVADRGRLRASRTSVIGDRAVAVPGNAEEVLRQIYGESWSIPDQGFVLEEGVNRSLDYLLTPAEMEEVQRIDPDCVHAVLTHHPRLLREDKGRS